MHLDFAAPIPLIASLTELSDPYSAEAITERLAGKPHLSLAAYVDGEPAG